MEDNFKMNPKDGKVIVVTYLLSVSIVTRQRTGGAGIHSRKGQEFFHFTTTSIPALEHIQPPVQWLMTVLPPGIKRSKREADHSLLCSAEIKNVWSYNSTPPYLFLAWYLIKHSICFHKVVLN